MERQPSEPFRHVFACLVHDRVDCVVDLVRNLQFFEPESRVLLYDGSGGELHEHTSTFERMGAVVHPAPQRMHWGKLHESVYDCLQHALDRFSADAITFVDSDQMLTRRGYREAVAATLRREPEIGVLATSNRSIGAPWAVVHEASERELWKPFLDRFTGGEAHEYPNRWIFWPGTVITGTAAAGLCDLRVDPMLAGALDRSNFASEEIGFSTAAAALGFTVAAKPWNERWVRWRRPVRVHEVAAALADPNCFWLHPVVRRFDDGSRIYLRRMSNDYEGFTPTLSQVAPRQGLTARVKQGVADGFFGALAKGIDGIGASEARAALARARRAQA